MYLKYPLNPVEDYRHCVYFYLTTVEANNTNYNATVLL